MTTNKSDYGASFAAAGYVGYSTSLAALYVKQEKYNEAYPYIKQAHDSSKTVRGNLNALYAKVLIALGKDNEAFEIINEAVKKDRQLQK
jgi:predicted Zn-dependent protease